MGCSPTKSHSFAGVQNTLRKGRALLPASNEKNSRLQSFGRENGSSSSPGKADDNIRERGGGTGGRGEGKGSKSAAQLPQKPSLLTQKRATLSTATHMGPLSDKLWAKDIKIDMEPEVNETQEDAVEEKTERKGGQKTRKSKVHKSGTKKVEEKKPPVIKEKVDFPEALVKAHQAAYAYLNPSIAMCEVLLGLLDQAAQTQLSLQPMVSFMTLRYEDVNRALAQIADEGERILKENGEHLAWSCPLKNLSITSGKKNDPTAFEEQPPNLMQQLLQYTTQRMRLVSHSLGSIADSALEDTAEYFASLSELLDEKLKAKRAVAARLAQVLTRMELAAVYRPGPNDSTLFSEDSGIGGDSWSLSGSERQRESWESAGIVRNTSGNSHDFYESPVKWETSTSRSLGVMSKSPSLNSTDSSCNITAKGQRDRESLIGLASADDGEGGEDENGNEEEVEGDAKCPPPDGCHLPHRMPTKRIENPQNVEMTLKMKDAISGRIHFVPSQRLALKVKQADSPEHGDQNWTEGECQVKRPWSAAQAATSRNASKKSSMPTQHRSRSAESLPRKSEDPTLMELERTQKHLSERLEKMTAGGSKEHNRGRSTKRRGAEKLPDTHSLASSRQCSSLPRNLSGCTSQEKLRPRQQSLKEKGVSTQEDNMKQNENRLDKRPLWVSQAASTAPSMVEQSLPNIGPGSVKRLIDTFSQGLEEKQGKGPALLGALRGVQKCGIPIFPGLPNGEVLLTKSCSKSCQVDSDTCNTTEDLDINNLPPPAPEVLMDNSFEAAQKPLTNDGGDSITSKGCSPGLSRTTASQRLRASMRSAMVLPSRSNLQCVIPKASPTRPICPDSTLDSQSSQAEVALKNEYSTTVDKQTQKIVNIRHCADLSAEKCQSDSGAKKLMPTRADSGRRQGGNSPNKTVPSTPPANSQLPATPTVSRTRILPSPPSNIPSQHRRLPSPPVFKRQPTPPSSCSSPASRKLPAQPVSQGKLQSPTHIHKAVNVQQTVPSSLLSRRENQNHTFTSYAFKTPSPPASPRVQRFIRDSQVDDTAPPSTSISRLSGNARSIFCPASSSLFEAQPCPMPCAPQAWTHAETSVLIKSLVEPCRGRLPVSVRGPRPFIRRSHSDWRPSQNLAAWTPAFSIAHSFGSEPAISFQGLEGGPNRREEVWDSQSDLWAASRSVSHPDLCIVGQALHRE